MALPAGRYGVTKNQLLKIKKLPMNTIKLIEELTEKYDLLGTAAFKNSTSVVTDSSDLVESGAVYTALQGKADNSVIAPTENGTTASQAYAVGSHAIRNGAFITWKNAKAQGETINDASDYDVENIASILSVETGTANVEGVSLTGVSITGRNNVYKYGRICLIDIIFTIADTITLTGNKSLLKLPYLASGVFGLQIHKNTAPYEIIDTYMPYTSNNSANVSIGKDAVLEAGSYGLTGAYICQ